MIVVLSLSSFAASEKVDKSWLNNDLAYSKILTAESCGSLLQSDGTSTSIVGELIHARMLGTDKIACTYAYDIILRGSGSQVEDGVDSSVSIRAYNTVYWQTGTTSTGTTTLLLTAVAGEWDILDNQVTVKNCSNTYTCSGIRENGLGIIQTKNGKNLQNGYYLNTGFSAPVIINSAGSMVGQTMTLQLSRGASNWTLAVNNIPFMA